MNIGIKRIIFLFLLGGFILGCGQSPFLKDLKDPSPSAGREAFQKTGKKLEQSGLNLQLLWRVGPRLIDESKLVLIVTNSNGQPVSLPVVHTVKIDMPTMSHPNWPVKVVEVSAGIYELTEVFFTMEGYWTLNIEVEPSAGLKESVLWEFNL